MRYVPLFVLLLASQTAFADDTAKTKVIVLDQLQAPAHARGGGRLRTPAKGWHAQITVPASATVDIIDTSAPPEERDGDAIVRVKTEAFSAFVKWNERRDLDALTAAFKGHGDKITRRESTKDGFILVVDGGELLSHAFVKRNSLGLLCVGEFHGMTLLDAALAICESLVGH